jgi:hypothetical protein
MTGSRSGANRALSLFSFVIYLAATAIALVAPYVALALNVAVRLHLLRIRYQLAPSVPTREDQLTP